MDVVDIHATFTPLQSYM